jgi:hypothetical protein
MDFIVSKVAMAICALMVVAVLAGVVNRDAFVDHDQELATILAIFGSLVERAATSCSEIAADWTVPLLSDGESVSVSIQGGIVAAEAGGRTARAQPACGIHTWDWDGSGLNLTSIEGLDESSPRLQFTSGEAILIETIQVTLENECTYLVFVSRCL